MLYSRPLLVTYFIFITAACVVMVMGWCVFNTLSIDQHHCQKWRLVSTSFIDGKKTVQVSVSQMGKETKKTKQNLKGKGSNSLAVSHCAEEDNLPSKIFVWSTVIWCLINS